MNESRLHVERRLAILAVIFWLSGSGAAAQGLGPADVVISPEGIIIIPDPIDGFDVMNVRIGDPKGNLVLAVQSFGEAVSWAPDEASPDGYYHFEAVVVTYDPDADSGAEDGVNGENLYREHGGFAVVGGQIVVPTDAEESSTSLWQDVSDVTVGTAGYVLQMLVPAAGAQDLTAISTQPFVNYVDSVTELLLFTTQATPIDESAIFKILDGSGVGVVRIASSPNNDLSINVDPSGDIHLANNAVFVDRSATRVGIGTTSPGFALDIHASIPEIELFDESDSTGAHIQYNDNVLSFEGNTEQDIVRIDTRAREGSMRISRRGDIGLGTSGAPAAPLHVRRRNGSANVLVEETSRTTAGRELVTVRNNGPVSLGFENSSTDTKWRIRHHVDGLRVSLVGTGGPELNILNTGAVTMGPAGAANFSLDTVGNLTIAGALSQASDVNAKTDFSDVNGETVLKQLVALPISQWRYKSDATASPHLGPTAQDFRSTFGLGADDRHIAPMDAAGVAIMGVKELHKMIAERDANIALRNVRIAALEERLTDLEVILTQVLAAQSQSN